VAAEVSYLDNAALVNNSKLDPSGKGPRGDVWNVSLNGTLTTASTLFFDTSTIAAELGYQHLDSVSKRAKYFNGENSPACADLDRWDGCSTKNSLQAAVNFTPEWVQVFPNWDFYFPITANYTIYGNGASLAAQGVSQGAITYSAGIKADYRSKYSATLTYADSFAHYHEHNGAITSGNGSWWLNDRGRVTLTLKTAF
jgi:hypothetical protein